MSAIREIISEARKRAEIDEFLRKELNRAGYGGVEIAKTPLGTRLVVYAVRPSFVIGRGGESVKLLTRTLEEKFKLFNPQIAVAEVQVPELNPTIMASKIASALERGVNFRRACHWALQIIMRAGALGAEIVISGKLTTERARYEKFRAGYMPKVGDPVLKQVRKAVVYTQLKPGLFGIKVRIVPPDYTSPDKVGIKAELPAEAAEVAGVEAKEQSAAEAGGEAEAAIKEEAGEAPVEAFQAEGEQSGKAGDETAG